MHLCREIQAHISEPFWHIFVSYKARDGSACDFQWDRGHLFDYGVAMVMYEGCVESPMALVTKASINSTHDIRNLSDHITYVEGCLRKARHACQDLL